MENFKASRDEITGRWTLEGVESDEKTYVNMCEMLKDRKVFKFARYGDGEWNCIFNKPGRNCDSHAYFPDLGAHLRRIILSEPEYMVGIQPLSMSYDRTPQIKEICRDLNVSWYNADVLHNASIDGKIDQFIDAMKGRYIILVGPIHLANIFVNCVHIVIPQIDCWLSHEEVRQQIEFHIDGVNNAVVLLAASMMSEVIIDAFADSHHTFIDIGSVLDPYAGVKSRRYHHKLKI
jgi:hypothetical protein